MKYLKTLSHCLYKTPEDHTLYTDQLVDDLVDDVGVVHAAPIVWPQRPHVHARLVVPVRQEVVSPVMSHRFDGIRRALPGDGL